MEQFLSYGKDIYFVLEGISYQLVAYSLIFLPIVILFYVFTKQKYRWLTLLIADYVFFFLISKGLLIYLIGATVFTYMIGRCIDKVAQTSEGTVKEITLKKRYVLALGIVVNLLMLFALKYINVWFKLGWAVPIGMSYYTLQTISYMVDVYRGTIKAEKNIVKIALYLSFFPQIIEGPITRYGEVAEQLYEGKQIAYSNLAYGYQRILWGLFKKVIVADRLALAVPKVFNGYYRYDGAVVLVGILCFTFQLYCEFSGCMDIVIGSGQIFGIKLPENFRQPFFAKNAGDFWRRWHITLGTFLKDYVFYPISLSKPAKKIAKKFKKKFGRQVSVFVAPTISLFFVWLCNGLWHGPYVTYLFYGMFYFVLIFIENITEKSVINFAKKHKINMDSKGYGAFRFIKLFIIVNVGEMFFRAKTISDGFKMLGRVFTSFSFSKLLDANVGMDNYDAVVAIIGLIVVFAVDIMHEKGISIRDRIASKKKIVRWCVWYALLLVLVVFGAYGNGYSAIELLYAKF